MFGASFAKNLNAQGIRTFSPCLSLTERSPCFFKDRSSEVINSGSKFQPESVSSETLAVPGNFNPCPLLSRFHLTPSWQLAS